MTFVSSLILLWRRFVLLALLGLTGLGCLAWLCHHDPNLNFLPHSSGAEWIVFPYGITGGPHIVSNLDATFRGSLVLDQQPTTAILQLRAARRPILRINNRPVPVPLDDASNWKRASSIDVARYLQTGANLIEVRVFNDTAPPALWLRLAAGKSRIATDADWEVSFTGSSWRKAALAHTPRFPDGGNPIGGGERVADCLATVWPRWLFFGVIAIVALERLSRAPRWACQSTLLLWVVCGSAALLWLALFWHNSAVMPVQEGFDASGHLAYIQFIQERHSLPLPNQGFEMFQPPLYYLISAGAASASEALGLKDSQFLVLRALTMAFGIAHLVFASLTLRLLFPQRVGAQIAGSVLAAFLPMNLYLSHFLTNETLAAMLSGATIYWAVRIFQSQQPTLRGLALLGLSLGLAMLTKLTSLLLVPPLLLGLGIQCWTNKWPLRRWAFHLSVPLIICMAVGGWHYARLAYHTGSAFVGNWDIASGFAWWQDPGFHTVDDYLRFGRALVTPLFSGFAGFADGIYSTLWGDGLCGRASPVEFRPPWNYPFMIAGYILAIPITAMILIGAVLLLVRTLQDPSAAKAMLLSFAAMMAAGVLFMTLRVPAYSVIKAFYGLSALIPLACFVAIAWDELINSRIRRFMAGGYLAIFSINSFLSCWAPNTATTHVYTASRYLVSHQLERASAELEKALRRDPSNASAWRLRAILANDLGRSEECLSANEEAVRLAPMSSASRVQLAFFLRTRGELQRAETEARRAFELAPEDPFAGHVLTNCLVALDRGGEAIAVARDALATVPFDLELHYQLGLAAMATKDFVTAANQFSYTIMLARERNPAALEALTSAISSLLQEADRHEQLSKFIDSMPECAQTLSQVAWVLATAPDDSLRNGAKAVQLAKRAFDLTQGRDPLVVVNFAAAQAESGNWKQAIALANQAAVLGESQRDSNATDLANALVAKFRENRPFRDNLIPAFNP